MFIVRSNENYVLRTLCGKNSKLLNVVCRPTYRSYATRVSQIKICNFGVTGVERNVCRCTFNRYSSITQFAKLAAGEQVCRRCTYSTSKPLKASPEKSQILSCDTVVANERYAYPCTEGIYRMILLLLHSFAYSSY